jgi:hypothetical protein
MADMDSSAVPLKLNRTIDMLHLLGFDGYTSSQLNQVTVLLANEAKLLCDISVLDVKKLEHFQCVLKLLRYCLIYQRYR